MTSDETEGRIRAIEAVVLHLPGINPDVIRTARDWIRDSKRQPDSKAAEVKLAISAIWTSMQEIALDQLKDQFQNRQGA